MWLFKREKPAETPSEKTKTLKERIDEHYSLDDPAAVGQLATHKAVIADHAPTLVGGSKMLEDTHVIQLKKNLPLHPSMQPKWLLLYDSVRMGLSVNSFMDKVFGRGPTIIVIKDTDGNVFGGFGSESWKKSPKYYGDDACFLFSIKGDEVKVYKSSKRNQFYMYFNHGNQYNPYNGLAMGGTGNFDYFPLALDKTFSKGESRSSLLTYSNSPCLLGEDAYDDIFTVGSIEVWGFELTESDRINLEYEQTVREEKRGVLKGDDNADLYMMQQAGRVGQGAMYRAEVEESKNKQDTF
ncbi:hypothetical protein AKO1_007165 [Acrasis kona]|uniref:Oxidation resistance protein 1 n=1 Tax=Acrasis kona TaxID=1008807 RepID=A0AAW2YTZ3_9EUKA